jgi:hypothetical protein
MTLLISKLRRFCADTFLIKEQVASYFFFCCCCCVVPIPLCCAAGTACLTSRTRLPPGAPAASCAPTCCPCWWTCTAQAAWPTWPTSRRRATSPACWCITLCTSLSCGTCWQDRQLVLCCFCCCCYVVTEEPCCSITACILSVIVIIVL